MCKPKPIEATLFIANVDWHLLGTSCKLDKVNLTKAKTPKLVIYSEGGSIL